LKPTGERALIRVIHARVILGIVDTVSVFPATSLCHIHNVEVVRFLPSEETGERTCATGLPQPQNAFALNLVLTKDLYTRQRHH